MVKGFKGSHDLFLTYAMLFFCCCFLFFVFLFFVFVFVVFLCAKIPQCILKWSLLEIHDMGSKMVSVRNHYMYSKIDMYIILKRSLLEVHGMRSKMVEVYDKTVSLATLFYS